MPLTTTSTPFFINDDSESPAPVRDTAAALSYASHDCAFVFHDLASPAVAEPPRLAVGRDSRWVPYQTAQIMAMAWRGTCGRSHVPDPNVLAGAGRTWPVFRSRGSTCSCLRGRSIPAVPRTDVPRTGDSPSVCIVTSELIRAIQERRRRHVDDRTGGTARDEGLKVTVLYTGAVWTPKVRLGPWIKYSAACGIELLPLATQNGTFPNRVLRIRLAPGGLAVESVETLFANDPRMTDPTLGVLARNRFFFNANGQWDEKDPARQLEALVLSVPVR